MEPQSLQGRYGHYFKELARLTRGENNITEENVYQPANTEIRKIMDAMVAENVLPSSELRGLDNFADFLQKVKEGKRGLILMEHYSNFDLPGFCYLLEREGGEVGRDISQRLVAISGMKLNEENPMVSAWAEAYSRIVIYPSRSLSSIKDPEQHHTEEMRSRKINLSSMRAMDRIRRQGKVLLVFPAGTRYRPENPETRKGVREIDSYLRLSDIMILVSINGNCLRMSNDSKNMLADLVYEDKIIMEGSPVMDCKEFRDTILADIPESVEDKKQVVVNRLMDTLCEMHEKNEDGRCACNPK